MTELFGAMSISAHGMKAQGTRIRISAENIANATTAALSPDTEPYARKSVTFKNILDKEVGFKVVDVAKISEDRKKPFPMKFMPDHPGADENGLVKMPNVETLIEMNDMREAQRTYEANLGMMRQSKSMIMQTISLLRQ